MVMCGCMVGGQPYQPYHGTMGEVRMGTMGATADACTWCCHDKVAPGYAGFQWCCSDVKP